MNESPINENIRNRLCKDRVVSFHAQLIYQSIKGGTLAAENKVIFLHLQGRYFL